MHTLTCGRCADLASQSRCAPSSARCTRTRLLAPAAAARAAARRCFARCSACGRGDCARRERLPSDFLVAARRRRAAVAATCTVRATRRCGVPAARVCALAAAAHKRQLVCAFCGRVLLFWPPDAFHVRPRRSDVVRHIPRTSRAVPRAEPWSTAAASTRWKAGRATRRRAKRHARRLRRRSRRTHELAQRARDQRGAWAAAGREQTNIDESTTAKRKMTSTP